MVAWAALAAHATITLNTSKLTASLHGD